MSTTHTTTIGGPGTNPEDIAASAGLPHAGPRTSEDALAANRRLATEASEALNRPRQRPQAAGEGATETVGKVKEGLSSAASDVGDRVSQTARNLGDKASQAYDDTRDWAADQQATHRRRIADLSEGGRERLEQGRSAVESFVSENPLLVGVVGVAAGLLLGALLPRTRAESEAVGPWADDLRDQGLRYARDITSKGREFVENALDPDNLNAAAQRATAENDVPGGGPRPRTH